MGDDPTRRTYMGEYEFNKRTKTKELKPVSEIVMVPVPPVIDRDTFDTMQKLLKARNPKITPAAVISGPTMLTGLIHCAKCGGAMTIRTGKGGRYRYYACSMKARQGPTACEGMAAPMDKLDNLVASHLENQLLRPERLETILAAVLDRWEEHAERRRGHIAELNKRVSESELHLKRLYDAIEAGVADNDDPALKDRIDSLKAIRDQAKADAERAQAMLQNSGQKAVTPQMLRTFAKNARQSNETHFARELAEAALAHVIGDKAEQAYRRSDALEKRRALMEAWASYCEGVPAGNVLPLRKA